MLFSCQHMERTQINTNMDPLTIAALAGGTFNAITGSKPVARADFSKSADALKQGFASTQNQLQGDAARGQQLAGADALLANAGKLRQDANAYERNQAIDGVLAAYGGDPLGSGARGTMAAQLAQLARGNWQNSLNAAGGVAQNQLGVQNSLMEGNSQLGTAQTQSMASLLAQQAQSDANAKDQRGIVTKTLGGLF